MPRVKFVSRYVQLVTLSLVTMIGSTDLSIFKYYSSKLWLSMVVLKCTSIDDGSWHVMLQWSENRI